MTKKKHSCPVCGFTNGDTLSATEALKLIEKFATYQETDKEENKYFAPAFKTQEAGWFRATNARFATIALLARLGLKSV